MGDRTKIEWADHTFNPWRGCTKVSPGCAHCYAEAQSRINPRVLGQWGPGATRAVASEAYWGKPRRWLAEARQAGERRRVFCASMADVFDAEAPRAARNRLWETIVATSGYLRGMEGGGLDWLLLTKRPERIGDVLREDRLRPTFFRDNGCWVGTSVESQEYLRRIGPAHHWGVVSWISAEPLLGPLDLTNWADRLHWVIVGGESGGPARPCDLAWIRSIRDQCRAAGVPCFVKQLGSNPKGNCSNCTLVDTERLHCRHCDKLSDPKGGDPDEWPEDLRMRELPTIGGAR